MQFSFGFSKMMYNAKAETSYIAAAERISSYNNGIMTTNIFVLAKKNFMLALLRMRDQIIIPRDSLL